MSVLFTLRRVGCRPPPGLPHSSEQGCVNLDQSILLGRGIPNQPILVFGEIIRVNPFLRRGEGPNWGVELSGGVDPGPLSAEGMKWGGGADSGYIHYLGAPVTVGVAFGGDSGK